ncbi:3-oxoacyl-ACP reductase FabG [Hydrogenophaga sp.]|uniref:3-oxoacyl-ACP reductase FabG n=1 Tax=Hydrogenophaga sp. TaxID=1904254 RepID=UPI002717F7EF|nr:3-oxoacyl-ACP reductase FabG [Hydrogenophaga sp.]MDO9435471.1 3-oxoacyl-ACP reductase FabG [Hydrogenophaga sp.]
MSKLNNKVAIVTGAAQGIGRGIALELARQGAKVALWDINAEAVEAAAAELRNDKLDVTGYAVDVGKSAAVDDAFARVEKELGLVDVLVNNAGISRAAMIPKMTDEQWHDVVQINLTGFFYTTRAASRSMKERGGAMVNISSMAGQRGSIGQINYAAAKAGVMGLTKAAAKELARYKIRANCICPGLIETDMTGKVLSDEKLRAQYVGEIPLARVGLPLDIAQTVSFLASDESSFITGQVIGINGGAYI